MTLVRHPTLRSIAQHLREVAQTLEDNANHDPHKTPCRCLPCLAQMLASRGWPASTISEGSRGADTTSSTERAAVLPPMPAFIGIDERLAKELRLLWLVGSQVQTDARNILAHGDDADRLPAGSGECPRCGHFCRPDRKTGDRIKAGLCPTCYMQWIRHGRPERSAYIAQKVKRAA